MGGTRRRTTPASAVRERLETLDRAAFVAFCTALWRARGYEVHPRGDRLVATRGDERLRLLPRAAPGPVRGRVAAVRARLPSSASDEAGVDTPVDVVVTAVDAGWASRLADRHAAERVGPTELANCLLYGVPRDDADEVTARHLGAPTAAALATGDPRAPDPARLTHSSTAGLVVAGVVCLVVAGVVGGVWWMGGPGASPVPAPGAGSIDTDTTSVTAATAATTPPGRVSPAANAPRGPSQDGPAVDQYPPGVGAESVDVGVLVNAHTAAMSGQSYRLVIRQSGTGTLDGGRRWSGAWHHAVVADDRTWLYTVVGYDDTANGTRLVQYTAYADGDFVYRRADRTDGPRYDRSPIRSTADDGVGPHTDRTRRVLERYLATTELTVDRPSWRPDLFRIVATGRPTALDGDVSNYTATAFVSRAGFVSELTVEYSRHEGGTTEDVRYRFEHAAVGETDVTPPGWYDEARAATANDTSD